LVSSGMIWFSPSLLYWRWSGASRVDDLLLVI
jgi:hypothetical protein